MPRSRGRPRSNIKREAGRHSAFEAPAATTSGRSHGPCHAGRTGVSPRQLCRGRPTLSNGPARLSNRSLMRLHAYATCLMRIKRHEEAAATLQRAVTLQSVRSAGTPGAGVECQFLAHKPQKALSALKPLLDSPTVNSSTLELASRAYEDTATHRKRSALFDRHSCSIPRNISLYLDFATICFNHESFQVGIDVVTEGFRSNQKRMNSTSRAEFFTCNWRNTIRPRLISRRQTS